MEIQKSALNQLIHHSAAESDQGRYRILIPNFLETEHFVTDKYGKCDEAGLMIMVPPRDCHLRQPGTTIFLRPCPYLPTSSHHSLEPLGASDDIRGLCPNCDVVSATTIARAHEWGLDQLSDQLLLTQSSFSTHP